MRKHLIIASYDGISTHYCGVGQTVQDTLASLGDVVDPKIIRISLAYIAADPKGKAFDRERFRDSANLVNKTGGYLIPLCNGSLGFDESDMWQSFPQWEYACASLGTALNMILKDQEKNVLMLHDTPFLLFQRFKRQIFNKNLQCYYMPRSSGLNYKFGDNKWRVKRVGLEKEAFAAIRRDPSSSVLAIGKNFAKHLANDYNLSFTKKDYLLNGLYFDRYKSILSRKSNVSSLKKFGIDIDPKSRIIFCWGRASVAKGQRELLEAWREVAGSLSDHTLLIQAPNNSGEHDYFRLLKKFERETPRTIVVDDFNPQIWQTCLRIRNTDIVCIPSTMDPNPHTAIEAKLFSTGMEYVIISSNVDGVKDTFASNECQWVNPYDVKAFSSEILKAAEVGEKERRRMREANLKSLPAYDYKKTITDFLKRITFI
jgi:glycosyltransferase involved in cell wall biosynthesis